MTSTEAWGWEWLPAEAREPSHSERTDQAVRDAIAARDPERLHRVLVYWDDHTRQVVRDARLAGVDVDVVAPLLADAWRPLPED